MLFEILDIIKQIILVIVKSSITTSSKVLLLTLQLFETIRATAYNASIYELTVSIAALGLAIVFLVKFGIGTIKTILTIIFVVSILFLIYVLYTGYLLY